MSNVLIIIDHSEGAPKKAALNGISFGRKLAESTGGELHLGVIGSGVASVADALKGYGAASVRYIDNTCFENYIAESYTAAALKLAEATNATSIAAVSASTAKDFFPRLAGSLGAAMASDVVEIVDGKTFKRPMWAGNAIATVELTTDKKVLTVRGTEFDAPETAGDSPVEAVDASVDLGSFKTQFVELKTIKSERPDVATADIVIAGGRGVKDADGFKLIEKLADKLGAGVGASRAVCDAGWAPNDLQIGQTGKVVAPDLYFAVGISGAIQHLAGMKGSKVIVAINKDPEAPIFQVADYGLVDDLFKVVPQIIESL